MSANLTVVWPLGMISVSDCRLTGFASGKISTNRSTKMTVFGCSDAHGVIVYNAIGMDDEGKTPSEWLMSLAEQQVFDLPLLILSLELPLTLTLASLRCDKNTDQPGRATRSSFLFGNTTFHRFTAFLTMNVQTKQVRLRKLAKK